MKIKNLAFSLSASLLLAAHLGPVAPFSPAQDLTEEELYFIEIPTVETAAKRAQAISEAPAAVTVITAEDIRNSGATNLPDLLRRVPGLEVMSTSAADSVVGARGQNRPMENGILVLVNGRSVYLDFYGLVMWSRMAFPLEQIEKIEVVRGPGSVLYGANAFHAVVNIITKTPGKDTQETVSLIYGPEVAIGTVMESGRSGDVGHLVSVGWTQFSRFADRNEIPVQYPRASAAFLYDLGSPGEVRVEAGVDGGDVEMFHDMMGMIKTFSIQNYVLAQYSRPDFYFRAFWNSIDADRVYAPVSLFTNLEYEGIALPVSPAPGWMYEMELVSDSLDAEAQKIIDVGWGNLFTVGANYRLVTVNSEGLGGYHSQNLYAVYAQHEYQLRDLLHSYLGVRYDYHPVTEHTLSPRGSVLVSPMGGHTFRLSAGRSFRNPTFVELYANQEFELNIVTGYFSANEDLEAEELISYEAGYQASLLQGRLGADVSAFFNQISGLIWPDFPGGLLTAALSGEGPEGTFENVYDEKALGVEAEVRARPYRWLSAFVNYSYTRVDFERMLVRGEMRDVEELIAGEEFRHLTMTADRRTPEHKVNLGVTAAHEIGLSGTVLVHHVGETFWHPNVDWDMGFFKLGKVDAYTLVNLYLAYRFLDDRAEVGLSVYNLLGDHWEYPETIVTEKIGRRIAGSARITF